MRGFYIGQQWRTERKLWLIEVLADSEEEAQARMESGEGHAYAFIKAESVSREPVNNVHYDMNEGMGR